MLGEAVQLAAGRLRPRRRPRRARARSRRTPRCRSPLGRVVPAAAGARLRGRRRSGAASSAGRARAAACSAARTTSSIWSVRSRRPGTPPRPRRLARRSMAITVSRRERATPLVVSVLPAQRRLALEVSSAITTQSSDSDSASARSTISCGRPPLPVTGSGLLDRVEDPDAAEQRRRAAVADRRDLAGLALAAVERAAEHVGLRAADGLHGVPEVGGRGLVGDVAELAGQPAVLDLVEPLAGELEVVPLHVDRPALVADDVDAVLAPRRSAPRWTGRPAAGCSETLAIRCSGMWPGESANAQPLDAVRARSACAIRRSSW